MSSEHALVLQPDSMGDATIARALEEVNCPALLVALIHLTGDSGILEGDLRPQAAMMGDPQGGFTNEQQAEVRRRAFEAIQAWRDRGRTLPPPPSFQTIAKMMAFMIGGPMSDEYVPMIVEEMTLKDPDPRFPRWAEGLPDDVRSRFRVVVVGAGMSGVLAAIRLGQAGIPYVVVEKNDGVGGTWFENTYPGCRVDVPNHFFSYSFTPKHDWPNHFSTWGDLRAYFDDCAERFGVMPNVRFRTEVLSATWDDHTKRWRVRIRDPDGRETEIEANVIVNATGQLNRPRIPDIPGIDRFEGPTFHSAQWQHDVALAGRRVAVVGTGASAFQIVPEIVGEARETTVFQRSAPWMFPTPDYHEPVGERQKWCLKNIPFYANWYRFWLFWTLSDGGLPLFEVDPEWPHPERSVNAQNDEVRQIIIQYIHEQVGDDPELLAKVVPDYPPGGKRMLRDNGSWLRALQRENVYVVTEPIREIVPRGIITADGTEREIDVIVFATGFHADRFLWPMEVRGRNGASLSGGWAEDPRAYLGITIPGFPNLFCLYGPNTNLVHGGSIIFQSECQMAYVMGCLRLLLEQGREAMECRQEVHDEFNHRVDKANDQRAWGVPSVRNWYKNRHGRVTQNWPWRLVDYWSLTHEPNRGDFIFH